MGVLLQWSYVWAFRDTPAFQHASLFSDHNIQFGDHKTVAVTMVWHETGPVGVHLDDTVSIIKGLSRQLTKGVHMVFSTTACELNILTEQQIIITNQCPLLIRRLVCVHCRKLGRNVEKCRNHLYSHTSEITTIPILMYFLLVFVSIHVCKLKLYPTCLWFYFLFNFVLSSIIIKYY